MNRLRIFCFIAVFCTPLPSYANFGLGPCCSGFICGIIPCDLSCAGNAAIQLGNNVSQALASLNSAYRSQSSSTNDVQSSVNTLSQNLINTLNDTHLDQLSGLEASTIRIESTIVKLLSAKEGLSNHKIASLKLILSQYFSALNVSETGRSLGSISQPISGDVAPNRAPFLAAMRQRSQQLQKANTRDYHAFQSNASLVGSASKSALISKFSLDLDNYQSPHPLMNTRTLSREQFDYFQRLLAYIVNSNPMESKGDGVIDDAKELSEKRRIASNTIIYNVMAGILASRSLTATKQWEGYYEAPFISSTNEISFSETMRSDSTDRLTDAQWWGSIKRLSENGLSRELTYMNASSTFLRQIEYDNKQRASYLTALLYASDRGPDDR